MVGKRRSTVIALAMTVLLSHVAAGLPPSVYEPYAGPFSLISPTAEVGAESVVAPSATPVATPTPGATPTPPPKSTPRPPQTKPKTRPVVTRHISSVTATWYCNYTHPEVRWSSCMKVHPDVGGKQWYAAAGPSLRAALGASWRGRTVKVTSASGLSVWVVLADWCLCTGPSHPAIDLYYDAFRAIGPVVNPVKVSW